MSPIPSYGRVHGPVPRVCSAIPLDTGCPACPALAKAVVLFGFPVIELSRAWRQWLKLHCVRGLLLIAGKWERAGEDSAWYGDKPSVSASQQDSSCQILMCERRNLRSGGGNKEKAFQTHEWEPACVSADPFSSN